MTANENMAGSTVDTYTTQLQNISSLMTTLEQDGVVNMAEYAKLTEARKQTMRLLSDARKLEAPDLDDAEREAACDAIKADLRAWLAVRNYKYVLSSDRFWLSKDDGTWIAATDRSIKNDRPSLRDALEWKLFLDVLKEDARHFDRQTYTFNKVGADTLNMLNVNFCEPVEGDEPHWLFDRVVASIGGEKAENIAHIERLILAKYLHPENIMIPALVLQDEGGTGKSLFVTRILGAIFGATAIADNLAIEEVCGKFNAKLAGKAVWFINETARGKYNLDDLKRKVGSASFSVEPKGVDAFLADMTAWVVVSGNDYGGSIRLSNNGVDRRWSIVKGGRTLKAIVGDHMGVSETEAKNFIEATGQHILSDRIEAGRWITALIERHGDVVTIDGHHGEDYTALADTQKSTESLIFEAVFLDPNFRHIKQSTMFDFYCSHVSTQYRVQRGTFYASAEAWAKRNGFDMWRKMVKVGSGKNFSKLAFFTKDEFATRLVDDDDDRFFTEDSNHRRKWLIDIG